MSEPFLGEIRLVGFNFAPRGWAYANGALLSIAQNTALFSLLGTTFGGNGQATFGLPDYQGRTPVGMGQGPGLPDVAQGEIAGVPTVTLLQTQLPYHSATIPAQSVNATLSGSIAVPASTANATNSSPANAVPASATNSGRPFPLYAAAQSGTDTLAPFNATLTGQITIPQSQSLPIGGSQPVNIRNPYLGTNFIIALQGVFPSRQ